MEEQIESIEEETGKKGKKVIVIALLVFIILAGSLTFGGYYFVTGEILFGLNEIVFPEPEETTYEMESFLVNLQGGQSSSYLKTTIALSFRDPDGEEKVEFHRNQIRDTVIQFLRSQSEQDITQAEDLENFKNSLIARINRVLEEDMLHDIYFTEFLIQ